MDEFDQAQQLEQQERDAVLAAHHSRQRLKGLSLRHCMDCGEAIPQQRRQLGGVCRCVECQALVERRTRT